MQQSSPVTPLTEQPAGQTSVISPPPAPPKNLQDLMAPAHLPRDRFQPGTPRPPDIAGGYGRDLIIKLELHTFQGAQ